LAFTLIEHLEKRKKTTKTKMEKANIGTRNMKLETKVKFNE